MGGVGSLITYPNIYATMSLSCFRTYIKSQAISLKLTSHIYNELIRAVTHIQSGLTTQCLTNLF